MQVQRVLALELENLGLPKGTQLESALENSERELQAQLARLAALQSTLEQMRLHAASREEDYTYQQDQLAAANTDFASCLAVSRDT